MPGGSTLRCLVILLVLVLLFRPTGILGRPEVEKV